jgi:hypothetical protein
VSTITMSAKFPGKCSACGFKFAAGTQILFDTEKRTAEHSNCPEQSYDGAEQASVFELWIQRAQEAVCAVDVVVVGSKKACSLGTGRWLEESGLDRSTLSLEVFGIGPFRTEAILG